MHSNPNLVPTVITDVNGKITTVHKKPQSAPTSTTLPAPRRTASNKQTQLPYLLDTIDDLVGENHTALKTLRSAPSYFLDKIEQLFRSEDALATPVAGQLIGGESVQFIEECLHLYPKLGIEDFGDAASYIRSLHTYDEFRRLAHLADTYPDTEQQLIAVARAAHIIYEETTTLHTDANHPIDYRLTRTDFEMKIIKNSSLVSMIVNDPEQAETIARIVAQHRVDEPAAVEAIMSGVLPALADGAL